MGVFSWNCRKCGESIINNMIIEPHNAWKSRAVLASEDGQLVNGSYDGYGRVDGIEINGVDGPAIGDSPASMYHEACWEIAGKPGFDQPSSHALDQGHFVEDEAWNRPDPRGGDR